MGVDGIILGDREGDSIRFSGLSRFDNDRIALFELSLPFAVHLTDECCFGGGKIFDQIYVIKGGVLALFLAERFPDILPLLFVDIPHVDDLTFRESASVRSTEAR